MPGPIESSGDIEIFCHTGGSTRRGSVPFFDAIEVGDRLSLVFNPNDGANPPYALKIFSPSGAILLDNVVRDLPTGGPHSPPPVEFVVSSKGTYRVEIREVRGRQRGEAKIRIG